MGKIQFDGLSCEKCDQQSQDAFIPHMSSAYYLLGTLVVGEHMKMLWSTLEHMAGQLLQKPLPNLSGLCLAEVPEQWSVMRGTLSSRLSGTQALPSLEPWNPPLSLYLASRQGKREHVKDCVPLLGPYHPMVIFNYNFCVHPRGKGENLSGQQLANFFYKWGKTVIQKTTQ